MTLREKMQKVLEKVLKDSLVGHDYQLFSQHAWSTLSGNKNSGNSYIAWTLEQYPTDEALEEAYTKWQIEEGEEE